MKSCDINLCDLPQDMWGRSEAAVVRLCRRAIAGAVCFLAGMLLVPGGARAQASLLLNLSEPAPQTTQTTIRAPVTEYHPTQPPLASDPGVLEAPPLIAREVNETDADYTARMTRVQERLKQDDLAARQNLARVLQQVSRGGFGQAPASINISSERRTSTAK